MRVEYASLQENFTFEKLNRDRSGFQRDFCERILAEKKLNGRVLDIGCGPDFPNPLVRLKKRIGHLDGVDPNPDIKNHPVLINRWNDFFEDALIPENVYDLSYSYNVLEHVEAPMKFFRKLQSVMKPGGIFWALTPHSNHPFCILSRAIEIAGLKGSHREYLKDTNGEYFINNYPSYYRSNKSKSIIKYLEKVRCSKVTFYYYPCLNWDAYFPNFLRFIPHSYDYFFGSKFRKFMLIFYFRVEFDK